jgi:hypothetical protein
MIVKVIGERPLADEKTCVTPRVLPPRLGQRETDGGYSSLAASGERPAIVFLDDVEKLDEAALIHPRIDGA